MTRHAEEREGEGDEDVDRVHDHEGGDGALRVEECGEGGHTHHEDAVLRDQAVAELCEAVRHPGIDGHVGEDARTVEESRLGSHDQQGPLGDEREDHQGRTDGETADFPGPEDVAEENGIHRLARRGMGVRQQVPDEDAAGGEGEGDGHEGHGLAGRDDARLP